MRSVKAGACFSAYFSALWLLAGCVVPEDSPLQGSLPLDGLSGRQVVALCDWARDYMGGYGPNDPEADEQSREAHHRCPPDQEELWDRVDTKTFIFWEEDNCGGAVAGLGAPPCSLTVDEFEYFVRGIADDPCLLQTFEFDGCSFTYVPPIDD